MPPNPYISFKLGEKAQFLGGVIKRIDKNINCFYCIRMTFFIRFREVLCFKILSKQKISVKKTKLE